MIKFKQNISKQIVEDVLVTALEGGSNYWYLLGEDSDIIIREATPNMKGEPLAMRMVNAIENGVDVPVYDLENENDCLGSISKKSIAEGTEKLYADGHGYRLQSVIDETFDATDADVIFQYWVMGKLVFG